MTQVIGINNNTNVATGGFYVDKANVTHGFLHCTGKWTTVDFPGTTFNQILGLNDIGQAAGYYQDAAGNFHPYVYAKTGAVFSEIFLPGTSSAQATGINNSQTIVGFYLDSSNVSHGWELAGGTYTALNYPKSTSTQALGINNNGEIVGSYTDANGGMHGFHYANGEWTSIDDPSGIGITLVNGINDNGVIVGFITISSTVNTGFVGTPQD
jgi:probable HAF family extracellular repeat protein